MKILQPNNKLKTSFSGNIHYTYSLQIYNFKESNCIIKVKLHYFL